MVALGPFAILLVWGGSYLLQAADVLLAPGHPVQLRYLSPEGPLTFRADSFALDLRRGTFRGYGMSLRDPKGVLLARAQSVEARQLRPWQLLTEPALVTARNVYARLELLEGGQPKFLRYIPEREEEGPPVPFDVQVFGLNIDIVLDRSGDLVEDVYTPYARVTGADKRIRAASVVHLDPGVTVDALLRLDETFGLVLEMRTGRLALHEYQDHLIEAFPDVPLFREVRALNLYSSGTWRIQMPPNGAARVAGMVRAEGAGLRYSEFSADRFEFEGLLTERGMSGQFGGASGGLTATLEGALRWEDGFQLGGRASARAASRQGLPRWMLARVPNDVGFQQAALEGFVNYDQELGAAFVGNVQSAAVRWRNESARNVAARVAAGPDRLTADVERLTYRGATASGRVHLVPQTGLISGSLVADRVDLGTLAIDPGLSGSGSLHLLVSGTLERPAAEFLSRGSATLMAGDRRIEARSFDVRGSMRDGRAELSRLALTGPLGGLVASGSYKLEADRLDLEVFASGIGLSTLHPDLGGVAALAGNLQGPLSDPVFRGRAEVLQAQIEDYAVPVLGAQVVASRRGLNATAVRLNFGSAEARGNLAYRFGSGEISGRMSAQGLLISQWLRGASGTIDIHEATLGGTLERPLATLHASGRELVYHDMRLDRARLRATLDDTRMTVPELVIEAAGGEIAASANFDLESRTGTARGTATELLLQRIAPAQTIDALIEGSLSGTFTLDVRDGRLLAVDAEGPVRDLEVNDVLVGSGHWSVSRAPAGIWSAEARVGQTARYVLAEGATYDEATGAIRGGIVAFGFDVDTIADATRRYWDRSDVSDAARRLVENTSGEIAAELEVSGTSDQPVIDLQVLDIDALRIQGRDAGRISLSGLRQGSQFSFDHAVWASSQGTVRLDEAIFNDDGTLSLDGIISGFDLSWVSLVWPEVSSLAGTVSGAFAVSGASDRPNGRASLNVVLLGQAPLTQDPNNPPARPELMRVQLSDITLGQLPDGYGLTAEGNIYFRSFTGDLIAQVPLDSVTQIAVDRPLDAKLDLPQRSPTPAELKEYLPMLDAERTKLTLGGWATVSGLLDELQLAGHVDLVAPVLAAEGAGAHFVDVDADLDLAGQEVSFRIHSATGSQGGSVTGSATATFTDVAAVLGDILQASIESLAEAPLQGSFVATGLRIDQRLFEDGRVALTADGMIELENTVARPLIRGNIEVSGGALTMPSEFPERQPGRAPRINPTFAIDVALTEPARLQASQATLVTIGSGSLGGSLANPEMIANLEVESGTIRLPTARVTIEEGGTLRLLYRSTELGEPIQRLDVQLEGQTYLTTLNYAGQVERYEIRLDISGNLLDESLQLRATSDPPDLSQEQILRLLGEAELLENLTSMLRRPDDPDQRLQQALVSFAIPAFLDPVTERLARGLGLDYLGIEYSVHDQATITVGKSLLPGLTVTFRHQIFEPPPGIRRRWEIRLNYRLPRARGALSRMSIGIGADQDRPWKINVLYGGRF
ncbi:MAG TPA: translocation/assembly module TamB domain-containing protein [Fimbriimonadaceae bacterium]|nr:translocation/assembly module TamB domain-containing protein [Fimbriimonadaceae bacterium]